MLLGVERVGGEWTGERQAQGSQSIRFSILDTWSTWSTDKLTESVFTFF